MRQQTQTIKYRITGNESPMRKLIWVCYDIQELKYILFADCIIGVFTIFYFYALGSLSYRGIDKVFFPYFPMAVSLAILLTLFLQNCLIQGRFFKAKLFWHICITLTCVIHYGIWRLFFVTAYKLLGYHLAVLLSIILGFPLITWKILTGFSIFLYIERRNRNLRVLINNFVDPDSINLSLLYTPDTSIILLLQVVLLMLILLMLIIILLYYS